EIGALAGHLVLASQEPLERVPLLDELLAGPRGPSLSGAQEVRVGKLLRVAPASAGASPLIAAQAQSTRPVAGAKTVIEPEGEVSARRWQEDRSTRGDQENSAPA